MSDSISLLRKQMKAKQISKIMAMKPGRELDAIVAEYIFGLQVQRLDSGLEDQKDQDYWFTLRSNGRVGEKNEMERVPNYSTVVYSAMQILAKFKHWSMQSSPDGQGFEAYFYSGERVDLSNSQVNRMKYPSLAEAICKEGLLAVVESNKLIDKLMND
ncbi:MAG TPA: hypothetical protein VGE40_02155 [Bacilli bacterium]